MPREIVGSQFENEDDERTWDELGIGRELAEDDDDYWDEDDTYRPKYSDAQVAAWTTYLRLRDADADRPPAPARPRGHCQTEEARPSRDGPRSWLVS